MSLPQTPLKVDFITLSRSDYASIRPVIRESLNNKAITTGVLVGGSHLVKQFGTTLNHIANEFTIDDTISFMGDNDDTSLDFAASYARAVTQCVCVLSKRNPDRIFIVGDRWELLAVATAASMLRIPIAHHSGGDITQGSADNQTRYAVSALSHLHFVALPEHQERLLVLGEEAWRVQVSGEPALTEIFDVKRSPVNIKQHFGLDDSFNRYILATFHPTTYDSLSFAEQAVFYNEILSRLPLPVLLTAPNPDPGTSTFFDILKRFALNHPRIYFVENMGSKLYYSAMMNARMMIGNSSSGLWEAPSFQLPVVNIGNRQEGRIRSKNVIDAELKLEPVMQAVSQALDHYFYSSLKDCDNPYVLPNTNALIIQGLLQPFSKQALLSKRFEDPLKKMRFLAHSQQELA